MSPGIKRLRKEEAYELVDDDWSSLLTEDAISVGDLLLEKKLVTGGGSGTWSPIDRFVRELKRYCLVIIFLIKNTYRIRPFSSLYWKVLILTIPGVSSTGSLGLVKARKELRIALKQ